MENIKKHFYLIALTVLVLASIFLITYIARHAISTDRYFEAIKNEQPLTE